MTIHKFEKKSKTTQTSSGEYNTVCYDKDFNEVTQDHYEVVAFIKTKNNHSEYFIRISNGRLFHKETLKENHFTYEKVSFDIFEMYSRYLSKNSELAYKDAQQQYFMQ